MRAPPFPLTRSFVRETTSGDPRSPRRLHRHPGSRRRGDPADGFGDAALWRDRHHCRERSPRRRSLRCDRAGGSAILVVNGAREPASASATVQSGGIGEAAVSGERPRLRDKGWTLLLALGALCAEWCFAAAVDCVNQFPLESDGRILRRASDIPRKSMWQRVKDRRAHGRRCARARRYAGSLGDWKSSFSKPTSAFRSRCGSSRRWSARRRAGRFARRMSFLPCCVPASSRRFEAATAIRHCDCLTSGRRSS